MKHDLKYRAGIGLGLAVIAGVPPGQPHYYCTCGAWTKPIYKYVSDKTIQKHFRNHLNDVTKSLQN